jgi:hypothetical protein
MINQQKLIEINNEIDNLMEERVTYDSLTFKTWKQRTERFLKKGFGEGSDEYVDFMKISFAPNVISLGPSMDTRLQNKCKEGLLLSRGLLNEILEDIDIVVSEISSVETEEPVSGINSKIFIIHGHDEVLKLSVNKTLAEQGLEPIILSEKANGGKTVIEKLEEYTDVYAAVALFTPDDEGKGKAESDLNSRARQNVVLETGFLISKLGRDRIITIADEKVELPSDLNGIVYIDSSRWELKLLRELKSLGFDITL